MRLEGSAIAMAWNAVRTRSRASETALSGRPTTEKPGRPGVTAHCTSTLRASSPSKATVWQSATLSGRGPSNMVNGYDPSVYES
jgi:hypothetical protein